MDFWAFLRGKKRQSNSLSGLHNGIIRELTPIERMLITRFAEMLEPEVRVQILADLKGAKAESIQEQDEIILFHLKGYQRPPHKGQRPYPIDGRVKDLDDAEIEIILFSDAERLYQLEYIRYGEGPIIAPQWDTLYFN